jgi:DNA-binding NarL/FixJ family response regulator
MKSFLVADDHFIVRTGISMLLKSEFLNATIDECNDGQGVWTRLEKTSYDLVVLDILMPGLDPVGLVKNILARCPGQKILIFSIHPEDIYARKYLHLGVRGYISKTAEESEIRNAITSVINNRIYVSAKMREILAAEALGVKKVNPFDKLSTREAEVLLHVLEGKNITEIARLLSMHTSTAATHKARILQKLGVENVLELNKVAQMFNAEYRPGTKD